jgi:hypothetical protein
VQGNVSEKSGGGEVGGKWKKVGGKEGEGGGKTSSASVRAMLWNAPLTCKASDEPNEWSKPR